MRDLYGPLALVLFVAVAAALYIWNFVRDERERKLVMQYCSAMGWRYTGEDDSFAYRWNGPPFAEGDRRRARNVVRGTDHGVPFVAFDYQYDTETSDGRGHQVRTTHHFRVLSIPLPTVLPPLQVTPEGALERAAKAVGLGGGIDLESEDFNRRFTVHAHDPKFASDVLTPRTMQVLLAAPPLAWRIELSDLIAWREGPLRPVELLSTAATLRQVVSLIPSFVWHDNGLADAAADASPVTSAAAAAPAVPAVLAAPALLAASAATAAPVGAAVTPPAAALDGTSDAPVAPAKGQDVAVGPPGVENGHDYGTVFGPHDAAPTTVPAPPTEGSNA